MLHFCQAACVWLEAIAVLSTDGAAALSKYDEIRLGAIVEPVENNLVGCRGRCAIFTFVECFDGAAALDLRVDHQARAKARADPRDILGYRNGRAVASEAAKD